MNRGKTTPAATREVPGNPSGHASLRRAASAPSERPVNLEALTLHEIPHVTWCLLQLGVRHAADPLHTPCMATTGRDGPRVRTVVLRHADAAARTIACHTDRRSSKVSEVLRAPSTSWHFYDRGRKLQLVMSGAASVHTDDAFADGCWQRTTAGGRARYTRAERPGESVAQPPAAPVSVDCDSIETTARDRFAAVRCHVTFLDWLYLSASGHRRAQFRWHGESVVARWVTP